METKRKKKKSEVSSSMRGEDKSPGKENDKAKKKRKRKLKNSKEANHQADLNESDRDSNHDEMLKRISSSSLNKPTSKILIDVLGDLSSLSSENTQTTNIELSERDIQRINIVKEHQKELKTKSKDYKIFRKRIIFDFAYLKTCSFYKQLFILILSILIILDCSYILSVLSKSQSDETVNVILQIIFAAATIVILLIIILFYLFNLVGKFPQESWLTFEFYIYLIFTIFFFVNTIVLFTFGNQFILQAVFGIFLFLNFFGLAVTKLMMAHLKITAQQRIEDPDGNLERARQLNARFAYSKRNLLRVWTV